MKNKWRNEEYRKIFQSEEFRNKKRKQSNKMWSDDNMIQKARERSKKLWSDQEFRNRAVGASDPMNLSKSSKKLWKSDRYRERVIKSIKKTMSTCEYKKKSMLTREQFIERAIDLHGKTYDYSKVEYNGYKEKVDIICNIHGVFSQRVINHLQGCGCPKCPKHSSLQEQELNDFIKSLYDGKIINGDRDLINPYEIDMLLPDLKMAIEYNGNYWHSYNRKETVEEKTKHSTKHNMCLEKGYQLIQITESEWKHKQEIVKSRLKYFLGCVDDIKYARKCKIADVDQESYKKFIDNNHLQGHKYASVKIGLSLNSDLLCVMSFSKHNKYQWEICRFANKLNCSVVGGANKIFKYFLKTYDPDMIMTYADRRYSIGSIYKKLGFCLDGITKPNYSYTDKDVVFSRQQFQKHKLADRLDIFDPNLTESQNMFNNGYRRLWDAGHYRFVWTKNK